MQWLERELPTLLAAARPHPAALVAAALALVNSETAQGFAGSAWLAPGARTRWFDDGAGPRSASVSVAGDGPDAQVDGEPVDWRLVSRTAASATIATAAGVTLTATREADGRVALEREGEPSAVRHHLRLVPPPPASPTARAAGASVSEVRAPLAGRIAAVHVAEGDTVSAGDTIALLEAMKLEHAITAPDAGRIGAVHVAPDDVVEAGALLVELA